MDLAAIALRVLLAYGFLLLIVRIAGKRSMYQGTALDLVVALILGDMVDDLMWADVPAPQFVVGVGAVALAHVLVSAAVYTWPVVARVVDGTPRPVAREGALLWPCMARERLTEIEATSELRREQIADLREIERATMEYSGHISVQRRPWAREAQQVDRERVREATE